MSETWNVGVKFSKKSGSAWSDEAPGQHVPNGGGVWGRSGARPPPFYLNAQEARARHLALRRRRRPALGGRGDGLFGQADPPGRALPPTRLLPPQAQLLCAAP